MTRAHFLLLAPLLFGGCAPAADRATLLARDPSAAARRADADATASRALPIATDQSRFDVVGIDVMGGSHPARFERWEGSFTRTASGGTLRVQLDMASARASNETVTGLLRRDLLHVEQYPTATIDVTLRPSGRGPTSFVAEGRVRLHGVERGLRFPATLTGHGEGYRLRTRFRFSRVAFGIVAKTSWDALLKDDVLVVVDAVTAPR